MMTYSEGDNMNLPTKDSREVAAFNRLNALMMVDTAALLHVCADPIWLHFFFVIQLFNMKELRLKGLGQGLCLVKKRC